jgi:hypothetical protein
MNTRIWTIAGGVTGALALLLLTILFTLAYGAEVASSPRFTVFVVLDILLGGSSVSLLASACTVRAVRANGESYVEGVRDTVDRLAEALPGTNIRRIS